MTTETILATRDVSVVRPRLLANVTGLADYWAITKPEVNVLITITTAAAFYIGSPAAFSDFPGIPLLHTLLGTVLVASGAATLNQWMEHHFDARMRRTARRPIAAGRIEPIHALLFGTVLSAAGIAYLVLAANTLASLLAAGTLLSYLFLYTPVKRVTPLCTVIGAVPGAVPVLIGWAAARGRLESGAWVLYAIVFLWQFPHFMAIAWMYRADYDRAGYMVLPRGRARAPFVIAQTLLPLLALLPLSLLPFVTGEPSMVFGLGAVVVSLGFLYYGAQFARRRSGPTARQLLLASVIYLPLLFVLMILRKGSL
jgi:heme o synthase